MGQISSLKTLPLVKSNFLKYDVFLTKMDDSHIRASSWVRSVLFGYRDLNMCRKEKV